MAVHIAVIVMPLIIAFVRTRSDAQISSGVSPTAGELAVPGLELREAFRSWSFWMIAIAVLLFAAADVGIRVHLIPYLTGIGYTPTSAAGLFSAMFVFSAIGNFCLGYLAQPFGGRPLPSPVFVTASPGIAAFFVPPPLRPITLLCLFLCP